MSSIIKPPYSTFIILATLFCIILLIGIVIGKNIDEGEKFTWTPRPGMECAVIRFDEGPAIDCYSVEKSK